MTMSSRRKTLLGVLVFLIVEAVLLGLMAWSHRLYQPSLLLLSAIVAMIVAALVVWAATYVQGDF
jgi:hypothetical protein